MTKVNTILKGRGYRPIRRTKLQETCGQLADLAETLGPDAKLPTVIQLRDQLGVSVATLNSALTELEAQRVIRRKHGVGIYVSPRIRQRTVCLICDPRFFVSLSLLLSGTFLSIRCDSGPKPSAKSSPFTLPPTIPQEWGGKVLLRPYKVVWLTTLLTVVWMGFFVLGYWSRLWNGSTSIRSR